jgi:hypothetical protein
MDNSIQFLLRRIEPERLKYLVQRELEDQVPCYYKDKYGEVGLGMYYITVVDSVKDFVFYDYTTNDPSENFDNEEEIIKEAIISIFDKIIKNYFKESNCSNYKKLSI